LFEPTLTFSVISNGIDGLHLNRGKNVCGDCRSIYCWALSIALALSLPLSLPYRTELTMLVFAAVVFSLLAQGLTVAPLLKWLRLTEREPELIEYEVLQGRLPAETAALAELDSLRQRGLITARVCDDLKAELTVMRQDLSEQLTSLDGAQRAVEQQQEARIRHHLISVKKTRLAELLQEGILSERSYSAAGRSLDQELTKPS
jgi:CPA1 family monovalent cation:H+ antiporter